MKERKYPISSLSELVAETINKKEAITLTDEENKLVQADCVRAVEPVIREKREKDWISMSQMPDLSIDN